MNPISKLLRLASVLVAANSVLLQQRGFSQNARSSAAIDSTSAVISLPSAPQTASPIRHVETSISVGAIGQLTTPRITETTTDLITQSLSPSAGLLATFRQNFSPWLGYSVNFGYTRATYRYTDSAASSLNGTTVATYIPNSIYETSVSYIAQKQLTPAFTVFGVAGAGAMAFAARYYDVRSSPANFYLNYRNNTFRPEGLAGFGIDYRVGHNLGLRAEYRGLFVKYPDYAAGIVRPTTISNEPTLSVTYTLGRQTKR